MSDLRDRETPVPVLPSGVVTFLLTDVVGSTRLWEDAPDVMPSSLERHERLIADAVRVHGGVLLKAKGEGDSTFSVFARASDALAAARDSQVALLREPWPTETPLSVRMSVHSGEAVERDGDYFGRTVNRAARLRSIAGRAQVVVSQPTVHLVGDALPSGCALMPLGVLQLRDLSRPEAVFVLTIAGAPALALDATPNDGNAAANDTGDLTRFVPMPRRLAAAAEANPLTGRRAELTRLRAQYKSVADGGPKVILIGGAPGIGKTGLASVVAQEARVDGAVVLLGRCDEDTPVPYQPWIEALTHLATHLPSDVLDTLGPRKLADLGGLVQELFDRSPGRLPRVASDAESDRFLLFAAVTSLLSIASANRPVVLVLDDLHWADRPSLQLLRHVVRSGSMMQLLVVVTYRDSEAALSADVSEVFAALRREHNTDWMTLGGLGDSDIAEMIEHAAGHPLDRAGHQLAAMLCRDTGGNPFFAGEILRHLVESGVLVQGADRRWVASVDLRTIGLPESVRSVIGQRVARLGPVVQQVLRIASVIGREFDLDLLSAISGRSDLELLDVLESAQAGTVIVEIGGHVGQYGFVHALIQQTLYEELGGTRRQGVHRQVAETLEKLNEVGASVRIAELAQHWMAGGRPADAPKMIRWARAAGDAAVAALAPDEAARWYADALRVLDDETSGISVSPDAQKRPNVGGASQDPRLRIDLLVALGSNMTQGGEHRLLEAARLARTLGDDDRFVEAMLADTPGWRSRVGEVNAARIELVQAALDAVGRGDSTRRARLLTVYASELAFDIGNDRCRLAVADAIAMARRLGDPQTLLKVLIRKFVGFWGPESLEFRLAASSEAVELADHLGDRVAGFWANIDLAYAAAGAGDRAKFDAAIERRNACVEELGPQPSLDWVMLTMSSTQALLNGRLDEAERLAHVAVESSSAADNRHALAGLAVQLAAVTYQRGDDETAVGVVDKVHEAAPLLDGNRALSIRVHLALGDRERATVAFAAEVERGIEAPWDVYWLVVMCWWADIAVQLRHVDAARLLYERLVPWHAQIALMWGTTDSSVSHYLGMLAAVLGDTERADHHFADAAAIHRVLDHPFAMAWTELEWARLLLDTGSTSDAGRAGELLTEAGSKARRYGFARIEREVGALLAR